LTAQIGKRKKRWELSVGYAFTRLLTKVPKENRIGDDGILKFAMTTLNGGRIGIAAQALGIASGAYELAVKYQKKTLANHLTTKPFNLNCRQRTRIEAARLLVYRAARMKEKGKITLKPPQWQSFTPTRK
jgi:alkylation response protein AidB-like acyl-CoA dehydrogenase